ncbi:MAG: CoA-transferase subunit beta [Promethearchaeota archaeon]|jgi:glutaconate CoA-transferase subunit B
MGTDDKEYCTEYTGFEMMLVSACRQIKNDDIVFNAFHWPFLAVHMAKLLHCPDLFFVLEVGLFQDELAKPIKMPYSISDPVLVPNSLFVGDSIDALSILQRGEITIALLSTSMVDRYGNCNTTVVGPYDQPIYRLPGGGGATEIAGLAKKLVWLIDDHTTRRLPEKLDFITDPGYLDGHDSRIKAGYPPDTGPDVIVSPFCIMKFDPVTKEAYLDALHQNITVEQVKENTGWDLKVADNITQIPPPTLKEIEVCRQTMRDAIDQYFVLKPEWTIYLD